MRGRTLLIAGLLTLAYAGQAAAQIAGTEHNLSASGDAGNNGEICVYCHTPHGSNTDIDAPLWNKPATGATYTMYSSTTIDGAISAAPASVSVACLTCHDGTQAMDSVINAPGMGLGDGNLGDGANFMEVGVAMLGADLSNDHPISIEYGGGLTSGIPDDSDFVTPTTIAINGSPAWWVDTLGGTVDRDKTDMILYGSVAPTVECASCHDPHADTETATEVNFMRISNAGSAVCLACHTK